MNASQRFGGGPDASNVGCGSLPESFTVAGRTLEVWIEVLESCLPTDEGYDEDTEAVLKNVIGSIRRELVA